MSTEPTPGENEQGHSTEPSPAAIEPVAETAQAAVSEPVTGAGTDSAAAAAAAAAVASMAATTAALKAAEASLQADNEELEGIKMVALESAELATRSANLFTEWAGFIATMIAVCALAALIAPPALGGAAKIGPFALAAGITALLFPLVRPLYIVGRAKA